MAILSITQQKRQKEILFLIVWLCGTKRAISYFN